MLHLEAIPKMNKHYHVRCRIEIINEIYRVLNRPAPPQHALENYGYTDVYLNLELSSEEILLLKLSFSRIVILPNLMLDKLK